MGYQNIFERREIKYLITKEQREKIQQDMSKYMKWDKYGKSTICNIYFDLPDYYLIWCASAPFPARLRKSVQRKKVYRRASLPQWQS